MNENEYQYPIGAKMRDMSSAASSLTFSTLPSDLSGGQRRGLAVMVVAVHLALGWAWWHSKTDTVNVGSSEIIEVSLVTDAQSQTRDVTEKPEPEPVRQPVQPQPVERVQPRVTPTQTPTQPTPAPAVLSSQSGAESVAVTAPVAAPAATPVATQAAPAPVAAPAPPPPPPAPREFQDSAVSYLVRPVEAYPRVSRELGEQGSALLRVLVDERGRPTDIQVVKSSGYPRLDHQAVQSMRAARFKPNVEDGVARPMWVRAPMTFKLEDN
jgi:protein TonB